MTWEYTKVKLEKQFGKLDPEMVYYVIQYLKIFQNREFIENAAALRGKGYAFGYIQCRGCAIQWCAVKINTAAPHRQQAANCFQYR